MRIGKPFYESGMSLVEVLVAIAIFVLIIGAVAAFQSNVLNFNRSTQASLTNAYEAQALLKNAARELRSMAQSANGSYPISTAATNTITFFADVDADGVREQVRYFLASTTLYRGIVEPTGSPASYNQATESRRILATGVRNSGAAPMLEYFDSMYAGTTTAMTFPLMITNIRMIRVNVTIDTDPNKSPIPRSFSTQAALRNLKDNL
jgi:prepilin-type N-terminal cleavage/methylation domain-containing protein